MHMNKVAVVILNWNGAAMLRQFLPGVTAHSQAEVIAADNASTDDSLDVLRREFPAVRVIQLDRNYGFAEGYNRALAQVEAEYAVLLNSDVEVDDDWVTPLWHYLQEHPQVAACQPKILSWHNRTQFEYAGACGGFIDRLGYPYCRGRLMATVEADEGQYDTVLPVAWATGAALMVRLDVYHEVGGLDARFFAHMEEIDLCWRLRTRGYGVVCVPTAHVYHVGGGSLPKENPHKTFLNFRNNLFMLYKNLPQDELQGVMRCRWWLDRLAALQFLLKGEARSCMAVFRAYREYRAALPHLAASRATNMALAQPGLPDARTPISLLWAYYIRGKRRFSQL